jgi:hypothetical protein
MNSQAEFIRNLETADLVLCDISMWNANVFFELGIRVALNRPIAMVRDAETNVMPFDTAIISCHTYRAELAQWLLADEIESLANFVRSAGQQRQNALWRYFGIIAGEINAKLSVDHVTAEEIVFDVRHYLLDDWRRRRIVELGKGTDYRVEIIGGKEFSGELES